ncbi:MAG: hypothetical protein IJS19_07115, partial [Muribaculaceae bacterium]|nr:hypothetical protein [Muribaculaceae bacterium]
SVTNATGGNAVVRYWTLVDDNGTACTTGTATLGQTPGNTYYVAGAISQDDGGRLIIPQGATDNTKLTWRFIMSRIADASNMYPSARRYFSMESASGYTTSA